MVKSSNSRSSKSSSNRAKPMVPRAGYKSSRNRYGNGGKVN